MINAQGFQVFDAPFRVEVDPFGHSEDGVPNIFIVDATGIGVLTVNKHPVWKHMDATARRNVAEKVVRLLNQENES